MSRRFTVYDPDRLNAFSDGIFAFAATLLVLQIAVPDAALVKKMGLRAALTQADFVPHALTFALSFLIVAVYRGAHQSIFSRIEHTDGLVSRLNTFFLLTVAFLPFTTALFASYSVELAFEMYAGNLAAAGVLLLGISLYASTRPTLIAPEQRPSRQTFVKEAIAPIIFLLSIPLSHLTNTSLAAYFWILLAPADPVIDGIFALIHRRARAARSTDGAAGQREATKVVDDEQAHPS